VAVGDFNGDGKPDLAVTTVTSSGTTNKIEPAVSPVSGGPRTVRRAANPPSGPGSKSSKAATSPAR
jgi:hypothetical protein